MLNDPDCVRVRQGVPTRVEIAGERYRFGITSTDDQAGTVHITVLSGAGLDGFDVAPDGVVTVAGRRWQAIEVDLGRRDAPARVRLQRVTDPA